MPTKASVRLREFAERISEGQHRPQRKFLRQALFGLHVSGDTMLSAWGRSLREKQALFYTEKRLSNGLKSKQLDDRQLWSQTLGVASRLVKRHCSAISVDTTDISKPYAKKMPYMGHVHDGSTGDVGNGWMVLRADGVANNGRHVPLHLTTFSRKAPGYLGDGDQLQVFLKSLLGHVPATMPFVFDAGHDGRSYRKMFGELGLNYTVRLRVDGSHGLRKVEADPAATLRDVVASVPSGLSFRVSRFTKHAKRPWVANVGWTPDLRFLSTRGVPEAQSYSVVVVRGYRDDDREMVLLTTDRVRTSAQARAVVERYFARWAVEDGHRLLKDRFSLENVRALTWHGLKRLVFLAHVAYVFMAWLVYRANGEDLARRAPAFGPVPKFLYYRLSMALAEFLVATA
jgi:hypothetical protein